ncbi:MAG TPA: hypothetical protein VGC54_00315 [Planctomycetota bacterium]
MRKSLWLAAILAAPLLAGGAKACIEALNLTQMVAKTDTAVNGVVTDVRSVLHTPEGESEAFVYTIVTVEGEDLYTGQSRTLEAAFLGGTHQGREFFVSSMPHPSEYAVGNKVLAFGSPVSDWGAEIDHALYASMGGIFRTVETRRGQVFLGKGDGFAVEKNVTLEQLRADLAQALAEKEAQR